MHYTCFISSAIVFVEDRDQTLFWLSLGDIIPSVRIREFSELFEGEIGEFSGISMCFLAQSAAQQKACTRTKCRL